MMPRKVFLFSIFKDKTHTELMRFLKIHKKNIEILQQNLQKEENEMAEIRKEINFRDNPKAQETQKTINRLKKIIENHNNGKKPLSTTRLRSIMRALELSENSLAALLELEVQYR